MVRFQMVHFSNRQALAIAIVPTIRKLDHSKFHSKSKHFCVDFKWFLEKWQPFVRISNSIGPFGIQIVTAVQYYNGAKLSVNSKVRLPDCCSAGAILSQKTSEHWTVFSSCCSKHLNAYLVIK